MTTDAVFSFCLYVAGDTQNSAQAMSNLTAMCKTCLAGRYEIEVVDVFREPMRALQSGVFMTPMLVKLTPWPSQRIVGTLNDLPTMLHALGLECQSP